eukprot:scaffold2136_cov242-Pinguiococcus_pyrenoidosus.AAC.15
MIRKHRKVHRYHGVPARKHSQRKRGKKNRRHDTEQRTEFSIKLARYCINSGSQNVAEARIRLPALLPNPAVTASIGHLRPTLKPGDALDCRSHPQPRPQLMETWTSRPGLRCRGPASRQLPAPSESCRRPARRGGRSGPRRAGRRLIDLPVET